MCLSLLTWWACLRVTRELCVLILWLLRSRWQTLLSAGHWLAKTKRTNILSFSFTKIKRLAFRFFSDCILSFCPYSGYNSIVARLLVKHLTFGDVWINRRSLTRGVPFTKITCESLWAGPAGLACGERTTATSLIRIYVVVPLSFTYKVRFYSHNCATFVLQHFKITWIEVIYWSSKFYLVVKSVYRTVRRYRCLLVRGKNFLSTGGFK